MAEECTRCGKKLNGKVVWLEFDQRFNTYSPNPVPEEFSQGGFPFGAGCAKAEIKAHNKATGQLKPETV